MKHKYYKLSRAAEYFDVSPRTITRWVKEGRNGIKLKTIEINGFKRITYEDLREFEKATFGR